MGVKMKTLEKIIEFFDIYKRARHNRNAHKYYKALYEFKKTELKKAEEELDDKKHEIKELKDKIIILTQQCNTDTGETISLRSKVANLEKQLKQFKKNQFKKGHIPWNKGKKPE